MDDCTCHGGAKRIGATSVGDVSWKDTPGNSTDDSPGGQVLNFNAYRAAHMEHRFRRHVSTTVMVIAIAVVVYLVFWD